MPPTPADRDAAREAAWEAAWEAARSPYDPARLAALARPPWREVRLVVETGSTNADLAALARAGEPGGLVLVAERQTAGKGRLGRGWVAPEGACVTASVLVRPTAPPARLGWLPLLAGLAVAEALAGLMPPGGPLAVGLKWPNDVLLGDGKAAGILAEQVTPPAGGRPAVVLGFGVNVGLAAEERPVAAATSLRLAAADPAGRVEVLDAVLGRLGALLAEWEAHHGDPGASGLRDAYAARCATLGRRVTVTLPGGEALQGLAAALDDDGRLAVEDPAGAHHTVAAGDVVHATHA